MHRQWVAASSKRVSTEICEYSDPVLPQVRKWIEECCGLIPEDKTFQEYLHDGTVLCRLIEEIQPGLIKRVNYAKSPFAWRENCAFFLEACKKFGLKGAQLCKPEDLIASNSVTSDSQKHFRNVAVTLYWLGRTVKTFPWYTGPAIQLTTDEVNLESQPQTFRSTKEEIISQSVNSSEAVVTKLLHFSSPTPKLQYSESTESKTVCIETATPKLQFSGSTPLRTLCAETIVPEAPCFEPISTSTKSYEPASPKALSSEVASINTLSSEVAPKEKHRTTVLIKVKKGQHVNTADYKPTPSVAPNTSLLGKELDSVEEGGCEEKSCKQLVTLPQLPACDIDENLNSVLLQAHITSGIQSQLSEHSFFSGDCIESSDQRQSYSKDKTPLLTDFTCDSIDNSELPNSESVYQVEVPTYFGKEIGLSPELPLVSDINKMQNIYGADQNSSHGHFLSDTNSKSPLQTMPQGGQESVFLEIEIFLAPSDKHLGITLVPGGLGLHSQVESIAQGSPASCSQLKVGDEIIAVNSIPVAVGEETSERIKKATAEGKVVISIKRLQLVPSTSSLKLMVENKNPSVAKVQGVDISRVKSDALPQGMLPKMVHCTAKTMSNASLNTADHFSVQPNIASGVRSTGGSDKDIHLSNPSIFGSTDSYLGNMDAVNGPMILRADTPLLDGIMEIVRKNSSLSAAVDHSPAHVLPMSPSEFAQHGVADVVGQDLACNTGHAANEPGSSIESVHDFSDLLNPQQHSSPLKHESDSSGNTVSPRVRSSSASPMHNRGIEELLTSLRELNEKVGTHDEEEEFKLLEEMLQSSTFKKAKEFHDMMLEIVSDSSLPALKRVVPVSQVIRRDLLHSGDNSNALINELRALLRDSHVQAILFCHDKISTKDLYIPKAYFPRSAQDPVDIIHSNSDYNMAGPAVAHVDAPLPRDVPSGRKENAMIVFVQRTNRPLGLSVYKQERSVYIGQMLDGDRIENLVEGDEVLEINGISIMDKATSDIVKLLVKRMMVCEPGKSLLLTIIPVHDDTADVSCDAKYVKAHFSFEPALDDELPCKPLGLSFQKGDILEISNQDDPNWWQARRTFEDGGESLPGLIPARHLMQKREALRIKHHFLSAAEGKKGLMSVFTKRKKKKIFYHQSPKNDYSAVGDEVVTYEDVIKLPPDPGRKRPIVLVGAPGVGKKTLIQQLLKLEPDHFSECIQHTNRPMQFDEAEGKDYYFVSKEDMSCQESFLECIEQGGFMYGIAYNTVKRITELKRVPILQLHPQALKKIRNSGLMPYIIFISSPSLERLEVSRKKTPERNKRMISPSVMEEPHFHSFTASKLHSLVEISCTIENQYGHYFDWTIVNDDLQVATDMLREVTNSVEEAVQWIPASWIQDC